MNILVIGNGFDLAHKLPTGYIDFLKWTVGQYNFFCSLKEQDAQITKSIKSISLKIPEKIKGIAISQRVAHQEEIWECIDNNIWIEYFLPIYTERKRNGKDGWIDFEGEISEVIQSLDDDMHGLSHIYNIEDIVCDLSNSFLKEKYSDYLDAVQLINPTNNGLEGITFNEIRDTLLDDLNRLIRAFEIYLTQYVENIDCKLVSPDIQRILPKESMKVNGVPVFDTYVLSFNYTNTYQRLYSDKIEDKKYFEMNIDYIHGKADINNTMETNNMVLGIDEYLGKKKRNKQVDFIAFKKFYQRIHKETGCKYKEWVDIIKGELADYQTELEKSKTEKGTMNSKIIANKLKQQYLNKHHVYIFGHSLDVTDKDILRDLILNDNVHTTIFYHNKDAMGQQIANLVKVIGQDELIKRTGGKDKLIEFELQKPMKEIGES